MFSASALDRPYILSTQSKTPTYLGFATPKLDKSLPENSATLQDFSGTIERECIQGSEIASELFAAAIDFIEDTGFWEPQQALNWKVALQWQINKPHNFGMLACLQNEDDKLWQAKPQNPRLDKKGKLNKYETPVGNGSRAFLPAVTVGVWVEIASENNLEDQLPSWVKRAVAAGNLSKKSSTDLPMIGGEILLPEREPRLKQIGFMTLDTKSRTKSVTLSCKDGLNRQDGLKSASQAETLMDCSPWDCSLMQVATPETRLPMSDGTDMVIASELSQISSGSTPSATLYQGHSFWKWVELHPEIPIVTTEGGKKSLCLLSQGYVSISLYGAFAGVLKWDTIGGEKVRKLKPELIADLTRFAHSDREWVLAFDQDTSAKTRYKVEGAIADLAFHLEQAGGQISIAQWDGQNGRCKGVDDLIVNAGVEAWETALEEAVPAPEWRISRKLANAVRRKPDLHIGTREFKDVASDLPTEGTVVLYGGKGTSKSEAIALMLRDCTWLSVTALRSVARDQAATFRGVFVNDGDRYGNRLLNEHGQPVKGGSVCLPSLLKVQRVAAEVLILDETTAIAEFLLISKLANKDGIRALLLAEFIRRVREAKLVILADADMTQEVIDWIESIRGERCYLVKSDRKALTYEAKIIDGRQNDAIVMLQQRVEDLDAIKVIYINCDAKALAKSLAELLGVERCLLIDSDTSGEAIQSSLLASKGRDLPKLIAQGIRYIISSPSVCQGFSFKYHSDLIDSVWGFYSGHSITVHGMAQGLDRVRSSDVERFVWVAHRGSAYSRLGKAQSLTTFLREFKQLNTTAARLVRHSLTPDATSAVDAIDWQNQNLKMLASLEVRRNQGMMEQRHTLIALLKHEGKKVSIIKPSVSKQDSKAVGQALKAAGQAIKTAHCKAVASAETPTPEQAKALLEKPEALTPEQLLSLEKFYIAEFYRLDGVTIADVEFDRSGATRSQIRNLEMVLNPEIAGERTTGTINRSPDCPQDWDAAVVRSWLLEQSSAADFIKRIYAGEVKAYTVGDIAPIADFCQAHATEFRIAFGFSNVGKISPIQVIGTILDWCGIKRKRGDIRVEGVRVNPYSVNEAHLEKVSAIISRREKPTTPLPVEREVWGGVEPEISPNIDPWLTPESLNEIRELWKLADCPESQAALRQVIPPEVLSWAIA